MQKKRIAHLLCPMTKRIALPGTAALLMVCLAACSGDTNSDCEEANAPAKTKGIGSTCLAFHYGSCPTLFTDCAQGTCTETGNRNGWMCLASCGGTCPSGTTCKSGLCWPLAVCAPFCDSGGLCCDYTQCAGDRTTCCQVPGSCS